MGLFDFLRAKKKEKEAAKNAAAEPKKEEIKATPTKAEQNQLKNKDSEKQPTDKSNDKKEQSTAPKTAKSDEISASKNPQFSEQNGYTGKFEINRSKDGKKFFFNLYASNKVGIATSQMYSSAQSALNGVKSVIENAEKAPIEDQSLKKYDVLPNPKWEIYVDNGGKYRFRLNASNGNCVCHSQGYTTKGACKNGIESIIRSSKNAEIEKTYIADKEDK